MKNVVEVLIIGSGVVGLCLSKFLENEGIDFLLIEKRKEIGKYGNRVISKEALKKLDISKNIALYTHSVKILRDISHYFIFSVFNNLL